MERASGGAPETSTPQDVDCFRQLLSAATGRIASEYFLLPVAGDEGGEQSKYRERVYAYELYHQLRSLWPKELEEYSLGGEIDKRGHPSIRGPHLNNTKPDLLVHVPRRMDLNLAVIEIKRLKLEPHRNDCGPFEHDLRKLIAFRGPSARYSSAFLIGFGGTIDDVRECARQHFEPDHLALVDLFHHRRAGERALLVDWSDQG